MKFILFLALFFTTSIDPSGDIKKDLCNKKWRLAYVVTGEKTVRIPEKIEWNERPWALFHDNGDFENELKGKLSTGKWSYNGEENSITTIENDDEDTRTSMKIKVLTPDSLELQVDESTLLGLSYKVH